MGCDIIKLIYIHGYELFQFFIIMGDGFLENQESRNDIYPVQN